MLPSHVQPARLGAHDSAKEPVTGHDRSIEELLNDTSQAFGALADPGEQLFLSFFPFFGALIYTGVESRRYTMNHGCMRVISNLDRSICTAFIILARLSINFPPSAHSNSRQHEHIQLSHTLPQIKASHRQWSSTKHVCTCQTTVPTFSPALP